MKKIISASIIFVIIGCFGLVKLKFNPFIENESSIEVYVSYKDKNYPFQIEKFSRLEDVLKQVPLDEDADLDKINETQILNHNDKIVIPLKTDIICISINHADTDSLMMIKGIGPKMAERIIEYRNTQGYFQTIEDLKNVKGIGDKTFEKLKDQVCI